MAEVFLAWPKLTAGAAVPSQLAPKMLWLCLKSVEITSKAPCPPDFYVRAEIMISGSRGLVWQELYMPSHGPAPGIELFSTNGSNWPFTQHWTSIAANLFFFNKSHLITEIWTILRDHTFFRHIEIDNVFLRSKANYLHRGKKCSTWLFLVICTIKLCMLKPNT